MANSTNWKNSLAMLNANGIRGKATASKIEIWYKGKRFDISKDFSDLPSELLKFKKDIVTVFGGRSFGGVSGREPQQDLSDRSYTPRQGHIEAKYIKGITMKEDAFLEDLKRECKKEIIEESENN